MQLLDLGDREAVASAISPLLQSILEAIDQGASYADNVFLTSGAETVDRQLWSFLTRWQACQWLDKAPSATWSRKPLSLCGIQVTQGPLTVRVLRSREGTVPPPGSSAAKQLYYAQGSLDVGVPETRANLILDWQMDRRRRMTACLSKPIGLWKFPSEPKLEWRVPILFDGGEPPRFTGSDNEDIPMGFVIDATEYRAAR